MPHPLSRCFAPLVALATLCALAAPTARAQTAASLFAPAATPTPTPSATPTPVPTIAPPGPIALPDLVSQAESASQTLRAIQSDIQNDPITSSIGNELPTYAREIGARVDENAKLVAAGPSLDSLRTMQTEWRAQDSDLDDWATQLTDRAKLVDSETGQLARLESVWEQTLAAYSGTDAQTPADILQRIHSIIDQTRKVRTAADAQRAHILELQNRLVDQQARVGDAVESVREARSAAISRLFVQESPPLWSADAYTSAGQPSILQESQSSFASQYTALAAFAQRRQSRFLLHALIVLILVAAMFRLRKKVRALAEENADLQRAAQIFEAPAAAAFVLSLLTCAALYPQAPRLLWALVGALALLPTIWLLRRMIERALYPILYALLVFYFVDQIRSVAAALVLPSRLLLTGECLGAVIFLSYLARTAHLYSVSASHRDRLWRVARNGSRIALAGLGIALAADVIGCVSLANLLGDAILRCSYLAIILYALVRIVSGLIEIMLHAWPFTLLDMVHRHRASLTRRAHELLEWLALLFWLDRAIEMLALNGPVYGFVRAVLDAGLKVGAVSLTLGHVLAFAFTVWSAFFLSRMLRFLLEEDIYPRVDLPRGLPYAISTMLHYAVLLIGFFVAVAAMGFDMTKFTILAGAFGVGLGFGMQNIVNNFVSGLILLFERPIKVGDVIQIDDASGVVQSIGIRASILRTPTGSELIVPNGNLIANRVTNWTYSNNLRSLAIPVSVAAGADPQRIMELLTAVARANEHIAAEPPPRALFLKFAAASMDFELRAWTDSYEIWEQVRSDLAVAISAQLAQDKIPVP